MQIKIPEETLNRYHALVDLSFLRALTPEEAAEKNGLGQEIDTATAPFYAPIIARLEEALKNRREREREGDADAL